MSELNTSELPRGHMRPEGMGWRVGLTIATFFGSMIAVILWLFFYAGSFTVYQNIALVVVILLAFIGVMGATWASWGMKQSEWWNGRTN
jgi:VIT1/CCC1 family predicted Fe2+/Mn2+ transporter